MAIMKKNVDGGTTQLPKAGASDYSKHLGFKEVTGSINLEKKHSAATGSAIQATTSVPVNKGVVDGGCKVGCSGARTVNLGNYESVKISVWLEMPCTKETVAETYDFITDWVGEQLTLAVKNAKE